MSRAPGRGRDSWPPAPATLPHPVTDNHTHLPLEIPEHSGARPGTEAMTAAEHLARSEAVGVTRVVHVACDTDSLAPSLALAEAHPQVAVAVAIHPNEAPLHAGLREVGPDGLPPPVRPRHDIALDDAIGQVAEAARHPRVRAIGETGLDFFRGGKQARSYQRESFRAHIALAKELDLPLQIHDREAHRAVVEVLLGDGAPDRTVFHCFSGDRELAAICAEHGWYASFAGPITFASNDELRQALRVLPPQLLLVETDAPYLTPRPYRGRPNAPWLMPLTVRAMAEELDVDLGQLCAELTANTERVYGTW